MPLISMIGLLLSPGTSLNMASMVRLITGVQINIFYIIIIRDVPIRIHTVWGFDVCKTDFVSL